jgi:acyl-CoA dehydrogenase
MQADEFEDLLDTVRTFVRKEVLCLEDLIEEQDDIPAELREKTAAMGLFGYALPEEYGGLGFNMVEETRLAIEVGYATPSFRSMFGTNNGIAGQVVVNFGTPEQKQRILPDLANGKHIASFALTEPEAGSDPSGLRTRAVRTADGWSITGQKRFITNATRADLLMVFARIGDDPGTRGVSVFAVDTSLPGVTVGPKDVKMGQRGSSTAEVFLDDVRVPHSALIGEREGEGYAAAMRSLVKGRVHIAGICAGFAQRILDETLAHAAVARQGGRPITDFQLVQALIADSQTDVLAGRALALQAAAAYEDGTDRRVAPSAAKLFCSEMVDRVADRAVQVFGGLGYMHSVPVERFYRDARLFRLYEGTSEIQRTIIAKQAMRGVA